MRKLLAVAFLLVCAAPVFAEEQAGLSQESKEYLRNFLDDGVYLATSPAKWDKKDWQMAGGVAVATTGLYLLDGKIRTIMQASRNPSADGVSNLFTHAGEEIYVFPALAAWYFYGYQYDDDRAKKTVGLGIESWFYSSALTVFLKASTHRVRPDNGDYFLFDGPSVTDPNDSFPSGHSSTAWSIATVIAKEYDDSKIIPPIAYGTASLVSLSRLNDNVHWSSDVFFSAATGYFIAKAIVKRHGDGSNEKGSGEPPAGNITVIPVIGSQMAYLMVDYSF